jgi:hypothetical protein
MVAAKSEDRPEIDPRLVLAQKNVADDDPTKDHGDIHLNVDRYPK